MKLFYLILLFLIYNFYPSDSKQVSMDIDNSFFKLNDSTNIWELYYSYPDTLLNYKYENGKYNGNLKFRLRISADEIPEYDVNWVANNSKIGLGDSNLINLTGLKAFKLKNNIAHKINIEAFDLNDKSTSSSASFLVFSKFFDNKKIDISDIELAGKIIENKTELNDNNLKIFKKNGSYVIPNPSQIFFSANGNLNFYFEIYNAKKYAPNGILCEYKIIDALGKLQYLLPVEYQSSSDAFYKIQSIPLEFIATGQYYLEIKIYNSIENPSDSVFQRRKFYVINSSFQPDSTPRYIESASFEFSEFSTLNDIQIKDEFAKSRYIAEDKEISQFEKLTTLEAKRRFLYLFWKSRDTDTSTVINEKLFTYRKLIDYADHYFTSGLINKGWKTDRGRILLKYGMPSQRNQYPRKNQQKPCLHNGWHNPLFGEEEEGEEEVLLEQAVVI